VKWLRKRAAHLVNFPESGSERDMIKYTRLKLMTLVDDFSGLDPVNRSRALCVCCLASNFWTK